MILKAGRYPGLAFCEVCGERLVKQGRIVPYGEKSDREGSCHCSGLMLHPYPLMGFGVNNRNRVLKPVRER